MVLVLGMSVARTTGDPLDETLRMRGFSMCSRVSCPAFSASPSSMALRMARCERSPSRRRSGSGYSCMTATRCAHPSCWPRHSHSNVVTVSTMLRFPQSVTRPSWNSWQALFESHRVVDRPLRRLIQAPQPGDHRPLPVRSRCAQAHTQRFEVPKRDGQIHDRDAFGLHHQTHHVGGGVGSRPVYDRAADVAPAHGEEPLVLENAKRLPHRRWADGEFLDQLVQPGKRSPSSRSPLTMCSRRTPATISARRSWRIWRAATCRPDAASWSGRAHRLRPPGGRLSSPRPCAAVYGWGPVTRVSLISPGFCSNGIWRNGTPLSTLWSGGSPGFVRQSGFAGFRQCHLRFGRRNGRPAQWPNGRGQARLRR